MSRVDVGGCVAEWDTNEPADYSGKPQVIISSPRIKHQIKPAAVQRKTPATIRYLFFHRKSGKVCAVLKEGKELTPF